MPENLSKAHLHPVQKGPHNRTLPSLYLKVRLTSLGDWLMTIRKDRPAFDAQLIVVKEEILYWWMIIESRLTTDLREELPQFLYLLGRIRRHLERLEQE